MRRLKSFSPSHPSFASASSSSEAPAAADFFFLSELAPYDPAELIPPKGGDAAMATRRSSELALEILATTAFDHDSLDTALRAAAAPLGVKAGPMFQPIRVAVCGRKTRRRFLKPWPSSAAMFASTASAKPKPACNTE